MASYSIDKRIYPGKGHLKEAASYIANKKFSEYFEEWKDSRWSFYYKKYIQKPVSIVKLN